MTSYELNVSEESQHLVAALYVFSARAEIADKFPGFETSRLGIAVMIDNIADHNQLMFDSIESVDPDLADALEWLMSVEDDDAVTTWSSFVDDLFEMARAVARETSA